MKTLTNKKAGVISRHASYLEFQNTSKNITAVMGQRAIGGPSATQTTEGIFYPTVQSAIDDIAFRYELPVGSVITNTNNLSPAAISQSDKIKFTGSISGAGVGDTVLFFIFGIPVEVIVGDSAVLVASKVNDALLTAVADSLIVSSSAIDSVDQSILNITYNDYQNHNFAPFAQYGCTLSQTITQQPRGGYGSWEYLGTSTQTLSGGTANGAISLYHYKRVS